MSGMSLFDILGRLSSLTGIWSRWHPLLVDLQPVQLSVLVCLACCSRYSNTPLGVTDYFGLTKGTVPQSLELLENKGLIAREPNDRDKRSVHLHLGESANILLDTLLPPTFLVEDKSAMDERTIVLRELLLGPLHGIRRTDNVPGFGLCHSCRLYQEIDGQGFCNLTKRGLGKKGSLLIYREHQPPETQGSRCKVTPAAISVSA